MDWSIFMGIPTFYVSNTMNIGAREINLYIANRRWDVFE